MNHSLGILSIGVKFALYLVHFMTNFELQLREAAIKFFSYFWSRLVRMKSSKKPYPQFLIKFLLFEILAYITFLWCHYVPLKSVLKIILHNIKHHINFLRDRRHSFAQQLFLQTYTASKWITPKIFWIRAQTLYAYRESSQKIYTFLLVL